MLVQVAKMPIVYASRWIVGVRLRWGRGNVTWCRHEGLGKERLVDEKKFVPLRLVLGRRWCECGVSGCSAARLARVVRDDEVESSNLSTPTNSREEAVVSLFFYFFWEGEKAAFYSYLVNWEFRCCWHDGCWAHRWASVRSYWCVFAPVSSANGLRKSGGKFSRPSAAILWKGVWRTEKIKAGKPVGLPRPFTVRGAFYPLRLRVSTGGGCCCTTVRGKDTRHR